MLLALLEDVEAPGRRVVARPSGRHGRRADQGPAAIDIGLLQRHADHDLDLAVRRALRLPDPMAGLQIVDALLADFDRLAATALVDWSGWAVMFLFILWALYREQRWIVDHLKEEVTLGIITTAQYRTACSAWAQSAARITGLLSGRYQATHRFYQLTAELAHKKQQLSTLGDEGDNTAAIFRLRNELHRLAPLAAS